MYVDMNGTKLKQNDKIRFLYYIKDRKNRHAFKKGDIWY